MFNFKRKPKIATPEEKAKYLSEIKVKFADIADKVIKHTSPNKCLVIIQDQFGNGIAKSTNDFTVEELEIYVSEAKKNNNKTV